MTSGSAELDGGITDYCTVPLNGVRDEGPLIAAAGWLASACSAQEAGECGPHVVLPVLYNLRFSVELALHGATHALEEARTCGGRTEQKTHDLSKLFNTWEENLGQSARRLGWYGGKIPDITPVWKEIEGLHELDPDGTHLRYPTKMPAISDVCTAADMAQEGVLSIVQLTAALVPKTKADCRRRLAFLQSAALEPCECLGAFGDWVDPHELPLAEPHSKWPEAWTKFNTRSS